MREAMISGMVGTKNGLLITISTAGPERKGPLWPWKSAPRDPRAYLYWCGAGDEEDGSDPKVWRRANPSKWITLKMLRDQYRTLPFPVFERLHLNRFPSKGTKPRLLRPALARLRRASAHRPGASLRNRPRRLLDARHDGRGARPG